MFRGGHAIPGSYVIFWKTIWAWAGKRATYTDFVAKKV